MLNLSIPKSLIIGKNLLGFSGGVDSSALFFSLLDNHIDFDIAIVNYNLREESKKEVEYAISLAKKYRKEIFVLDHTDDLTSNVEAEARNIRYDFFTEIIKNNGYNNLILAHQLNDKMEWLLMSLAKGAGLNTLTGFDVENKDRDFNIVRPMIFLTRVEIENYLKENNIHFFIDSSNLENKYTRNKYRNGFVNDFLKENGDGVRQSFKILLEEKKELFPEIDVKQLGGRGFYFKADTLTSKQKMYIVDKVLKTKFRHLISFKERAELERLNFSYKMRYLVVAHSNTTQGVFISVSEARDVIIPKEYRERYRIDKIDGLLRPYLFDEGIFTFPFEAGH